MASECCVKAGQPVASDYTPQGKMETQDGIEMYVTGSGPLGIVLIYDIFGFQPACPQVKQVADLIAANGFTVAAPDVFKGEPWPIDKFPPKPEHNFMDWLKGPKQDFHMEETFKNVDAVKKLLVSKGAGKLCTLGFCWGAAMSIQFAKEEGFCGAAGVHPSFMSKEKEWAEASKVPLCVLAAEGDPMETVKEVTDTKSYASKCVYKRFEGQQHGFLAARGNFGDPANAKAANEAIDMLSRFFKSCTE